jgi:hypothetical protein
MDEPLDWDPNTPMTWLEEVKGWEWKRTDYGWMKEGPCPRCKDPMTVLIPTGSWSFRESTTRTIEEPIRCNCEGRHARPAEFTSGCGQRAVLIDKIAPEQTIPSRKDRR